MTILRRIRPAIIISAIAGHLEEQRLAINNAIGEVDLVSKELPHVLAVNGGHTSIPA
jgi:hypothetical protein